MKTLIKKRPLEILFLTILGVLFVAFLIATIVLAVKLKNLKDHPDCDGCLACAYNPSDGKQVCCHVKDGSPVFQNNVYSCQKSS